MATKVGKEADSANGHTLLLCCPQMGPVCHKTRVQDNILKGPPSQQMYGWAAVPGAMQALFPVIHS